MIDIKGKWKNEFGSLMHITDLDPCTGIFSGTYKSTTGASGKYRVTGITDIEPDPAINSQTLAFAVSWRDIGGNPADANWVSAFSGQLQIVDGEQVITTTYLLQENTDPSGNWGSTIIDKAIFKRQEAEDRQPELPVVGRVPCVVFPLELGMLSDNGGTPWASPVGLGTPAQTLKLMVDTGTDNTWVTSAQCTTKACLAHKRFDPDNSYTYKELNSKPAEKNFGPWGTMTVVTGADIFTLKQVTDQGQASVCTGEKMHFEAAIYYSGSQFEQLASDGGIAIPSPYWKKDGTTEALMLQLIEDGKISHPLASFWTDPEKGNGECIFGAVDSRKYKHDTLQWMPLQDASATGLDYLWSVALGSFMLDGQPVEAGITNFVLDSGASYFKGPKDLIDTLVQAVTKNGKLPTHVSSASKLREYPVISLALGQRTYRLEPQQYFLKLGEHDWELGIQVLDGMPEGMLLVGSVFLNTVYCIFDYGGKRVGLANRS